MDPLKQQIEQTLVANMIKDACANTNSVIFSDSWCSQNRCVRFTTPFFRQLFSSDKPECGEWKTGDFVMYEINLDGKNVIANCVVARKDMSYEGMAKLGVIAKAMGVDGSVARIILKSWDLTQKDGDNNRLMEAVAKLLETDMPLFEGQLSKQIESIQNDSSVQLTEGESVEVYTTKYERNADARKKCLEAHGTACAVCGIDFGKIYGPEFEGKIEVHHIVPISSIGKEYVVDPVKDLIPVCPNCHTALHSKKGGVYTVEELKELYKARKEK